MAPRRRRKRHYKIDATELHPSQAAGLTQGPGEHDPLIQYGRDPETGAPLMMLPGQAPQNPSGLEVAQRVVAPKESGQARVPLPRFVGELNVDTGLIRQAPDGRRFADATLSFPPEVVRAIQAGMVCLKCLEPQPFSFADRHVPGCEGVLMRGPHYMAQWQIIDFALEFEGDKHIGPSKPMAEYDAEIEEKRLKHQFENKVLSGKSRGVRRASSN